MSSDTILIRQTEAQITEDHLRIRALLDGIHRIGDPQVLLPLLRELKGVLDNHFEIEEGQDGLYAIVTEFEPSRAGKVDSLLEEHHELMSAIDTLITKCNACIAGPLTEIKRGVQALYSKVQDHDAAETEMLTDVLLKILQKENGKTTGQA